MSTMNRTDSAVRFDEMGFEIFEKGKGLGRVEWNAVVEVLAFKRDCFAYDEIFLGFRCDETGNAWCVSEEAEGYKEFLSFVESRFAGFRADWFRPVAIPAFQCNRTTLWGTPPRDEISNVGRAPGYPDSLRVQLDPKTRLYRNIGSVMPPTPSQVLKWMLRLGPKEVPAVERSRVPAGAAPVVAPDLARIAAPPADGMQFTWVGHATWLIQVGRLNILTDPIWSKYCSPVPWPMLRRRTAPGIPFDKLPRIDLVLLSHSHYDHCDVPTLRRLGVEPFYAVPAGLTQFVERVNAGRTHEAEWGETLAVAGAKLTAVPTMHFSARTGKDRNQTLWCGWLLEVAGKRIYFPGDTGMAPFFGELGEWFRANGGIDVALLPIGAYQPRWVMKTVHCTAADAVEIHQLIGARQSLAMHWGTFVLTEEPLREPPVLLADTLSARGVPPEQFRTLAVGETVAVR